jgi:hypothetical protein
MALDKKPLQKTPHANVVSEPLPAQKRCTSYHVYKVCSIVYCILFILIGLLLGGLAAYILVAKRFYIETFDNVDFTPLALLLVVAAIIIITALVGCIGATCNKLWPLRIFLGIVILVFILQVVVGIIAYVNREQGFKKLGEHFIAAIHKYHDGDRRMIEAVDELQRKLKCCGSDGPADWGASLPDSCNHKEKNITGCKDKVIQWIEDNLDVLGATALAMAILHILGIFVVYMFVTKVEDRIRLFKYRKRFYNN